MAEPAHQKHLGEQQRQGHAERALVGKHQGRNAQRPEAERHQHQHQLGDHVEPVEDALKKGHPLQGVEARDKQRIRRGSQRLERAARPAAALTRHRHQAGWSESRAEFLIEIEDAVASRGEADPRRQVLRWGPGFKAANLLQGRPTHDERGTGTHHSTHALTGGFNPAIEHLLIWHQPALETEVSAHRIGIHIALGGLHQGHPWIVEQAHGAGQEMPLGHHIGIEHQQEIPAQVGQGVIEVACLGVPTIRSAEIPAAQGQAKVGQFRPGCVVQQPHGDPGVLQGQTAA